MPTLLHVAASPRAGASYSRKAADELIQRVKAQTSELRIVLRDFSMDGALYGMDSFATVQGVPQFAPEHGVGEIVDQENRPQQPPELLTTIVDCNVGEGIFAGGKPCAEGLGKINPLL